MATRTKKADKAETTEQPAVKAPRPRRSRKQQPEQVSDLDQIRQDLARVEDENADLLGLPDPEEDYTEQDFERDFWPISGCCRTCGHQHPPRQCPMQEERQAGQEERQAEQAAYQEEYDREQEHEWLAEQSQELLSLSDEGYYPEDDLPLDMPPRSSEDDLPVDPEEDVPAFIRESEAELAAMLEEQKAEKDEPERSLAASHEDNPTQDMAEEPEPRQRPLSDAEAHSGKAGKTGKTGKAGEEESDDPDDLMERIKARLGIQEPIKPLQRDVELRLADLDVPGVEQIISAHANSMARSLALVELMAPIAVAEPAERGPGGKWRVIAGRRRVQGAARKGLTTILCNVYRGLTPEQEAILTLAEHNRHDAWLRDLEQVVELVQGKVRLTVKELAILLGVSTSVAAGFIQIAQLPEPLVDQILAGQITKAMAKQLTRLRPSMLDKLAEKAAGGDRILPEDITTPLKLQQSAGLAALPLSVPEEPQEVAGATGEEQDSPRDLRGLLVALTRSGSSSARARLLATALLEELGL